MKKKLKIKKTVVQPPSPSYKKEETEF